MKSKDLEISDNELHAYIQGQLSALSDETLELLSLYEIIRDMHMRYDNRKSIIRYLKLKNTSLSDYIANKVINKALNFFYADNEVSKSAYRNIYADRLEKAAGVVLLNATCAGDMKIFAEIMEKAAIMRRLDQEEELKIPEQLLERRAIFYTDNPEKLGYKKQNMQEVRDYIDSLDQLTNQEKDYIKRQADGFTLDQLQNAKKEA